ncbi:hypothetical protein HMPREF3192_01179, partial [Atopobium deltae]
PKILKTGIYTSFFPKILLFGISLRWYNKDDIKVVLLLVVTTQK